ncbi:MAG: tyrosine-type recombinase/integrase [Terriglobia bacterium]
MRTVSGEDNVQGFLESTRSRSGKAALAYRTILRSFLRFVRARPGNSDMCEETMHAWLKECREHSPMHRVVYNARLVDRFLDWMQGCGRIASNPFQDLRDQYGHRTAPIVRALLGEDPRAALEALRPLRAFASGLGPLMREHVALMRSLGHRYNAREDSFRRFDRFLQRRPDLVGRPLPVLIDAWRISGKGLQHAYEAQQCGQILSKAQSRLDPSAPAVAVDRRLWRQVHAAHRRPYIYTEQEVAKLLTTARSFPSPMSALLPLTLYTMLVLAYCAGLRLREGVYLTLDDVNLEEGTIEIRETKFFKHRRLPLTPDVVSALRTYLQERNKVGAPTADTDGFFWNDWTGKRYALKTAREVLTEVLRRSGLKPERGKGRVGPRIHDLRHAMVCNRMLSWYQQGINPQSRLAHLSTYLGHRDINSTLAYLTITPELLQLASERFRQHAVHVLQKTEKRA